MGPGGSFLGPAPEPVILLYAPAPLYCAGPGNIYAPLGQPLREEV